MNIRFIQLMLCIMLFGQIGSAQLPKPIRYYPLDAVDFKETINRKDGIIMRGAAWSYPDRFGNLGGAIELSQDAYVKTPSFFEGSSIENGYTFSFWIYINENYTRYNGVYPWEDTDKIFRVFHCYNSKDSCNLLGFYHRRDRAVVDRYTINVHQDKFKNWGIWYWDPINFTKRTGWYQVFLVCKDNMTWLYVFYPNSQMEYALYYMGTQTLDIADSWGLGSITPYTNRYMDDFKVYNQTLTKEQIIELHTRESPPNGMYEISSAFALEKVVQTEDKSILAGSGLRLNYPTTGRELTYQWVIVPQEDKQNVYRIRMAYTSLYMGRRSDASPEVFIQGDFGQTRVLEWYIEPAGDGYFFIRSAYNKSRYLRVTYRNSLEVAIYNSAQAPYYKWKLKQLHSAFELSQSLFDPKKAYQIIDNYNTIMGLIPQRPVVRPSTGLSVGREAYPSLMSHYTFTKDEDNSYAIRNATYTNMAMYPEDLSISNWSAVDIRDWSSQNSIYHKYIVERTNPLGRHIVIRPVMSQDKYVYSGNYPTGNDVTFVAEKEQEVPAAKEWQYFYNGNNPNANRQISTLTPGIYKIKSFADQGACIRPANFDFTKGTKLELDLFRTPAFTSYYWIVDYEKDNNGQPVRDGSFTLRVYGSDSLYLAPAYNDISEGAQIYLEDLNRDNIAFYKWFLEPLRDKTNAFYITNGADKLKYLQSPAGPIPEHSPIKFAYKRSSEKQETFKWLFEKATIDTPLDEGVYTLTIADYSFLGVHTQQESTTPGVAVWVNQPTAGTYRWKLIKNPDSSYLIQVDGTDLCMHTKGNSTKSGAQVVVDKYDPKYSYSYKWIISKTDQKDVYQINLVGNPYGGYLHLTDNEVQTSNTLSAGQYIAAEDYGYKFRIVKAE